MPRTPRERSRDLIFRHGRCPFSCCAHAWKLNLTMWPQQNSNTFYCLRCLLNPVSFFPSCFRFLPCFSFSLLFSSALCLSFGGLRVRLLSSFFSRLVSLSFFRFCCFASPPLCLVVSSSPPSLVLVLLVSSCSRLSLFRSAR